MIICNFSEKKKNSLEISQTIGRNEKVAKIFLMESHYIYSRSFNCLTFHRPYVIDIIMTTSWHNIKGNYTPGIYAEGYIVFAFPFVLSYVRSFVCASVTFVEFMTKFFTELHESFSSGVYLMNHSSESIHIWTIGTLEGRLSFHDSWPQGPCPRVGLDFSVMETTDTDSWSDMAQSCNIEGQHDLYFTIQWSCLISWRLFHVCASYFGIMNQYDPRFDLKINVGHCDLYFMVQWFCLVSWRLFDVWTSLFGIMNPYDPMFNLKIIVGHCDLYFMVQWFWLISWSLFDACTSYLGIMIQYDPEVKFKNKCRSWWPIFYGPMILPCILKTIWCMNIIIWDYESVWL